MCPPPPLKLKFFLSQDTLTFAPSVTYIFCVNFTSLLYPFNFVSSFISLLPFLQHFLAFCRSREWGCTVLSTYRSLTWNICYKTDLSLRLAGWRPWWRTTSSLRWACPRWACPSRASSATDQPWAPGSPAFPLLSEGWKRVLSVQYSYNNFKKSLFQNFYPL